MNEQLAIRLGRTAFQGEALWIGNLGHFFILASFVFSFVAFLAYAWSSRKASKDVYLSLARIGFYIHGVSVLAVFLLLFVMIVGHHFEYYYAWRHSSMTLPIKYIISSFWEGQEGSFLLWQFWHVILGLVVMRRAGKWEAPVMATVSLTQFLLGSMVLGIYVLGYKVGVNPFVLLRHEMADAPIFQQADYLSFIADGNGLNPLLQNYWMVIHPPVLFLGFASTVVPFAYALSALLRPNDNSWLTPAIRWSLFAGAALGTGILMGGAWAYESLSFGGFWAWDPVENASLVPWIILVAGLHVLVAYKATKRGRFMALLFLLLSFILILYSTFLTRSGILGDSSVHSFTDLGMQRQLLVYLIALTLPALVLWAWRAMKDSAVSGKRDDEPWQSREFWMFVGSLIFFISAIQISFDTSLPVFNKLFGTSRTLADPVTHYNSIQIYAGILLAAFSAAVQYTAYKSKRFPKFFAHLLGTLVLSAALAVGIHIAMDIALFMKFGPIPFLSTYFMLSWMAVFAVLSNLWYIIYVFKTKVAGWGASVAHIGFALMLIGILISQHKQEVISINTAGIDYGEAFEANDKRENILLIKGETVEMGPYEATYVGKRIDEPNQYYRVLYERKDKETGKVLESFELAPYAQVNPSMGLVSNPDTRHYLHRDIFTHVSSIPNNEEEGVDSVLQKSLTLGDTVFLSRHMLMLDSMVRNPSHDSVTYSENIVGLGAALRLEGFDNSKKTLLPVYIIDLASAGQVYSLPDTDEVNGITVGIQYFDPKEERVDLIIQEADPADDFIILKAIVFPWINILWLGAIVMVVGFLWSLVARLPKKRSKA